MFTIDMTTITSNDGEKLVTHLKSEDFFNVSGYNTSTLKLLKITPDTAANTYTVVAALTIKGITDAITFPAVIEVTDTQVTAKATLSIDRTRWNIKYGSASIFSDIGDKAIDDKIEYNVKIVLK
jgi:polyisoprenoid-binding protein YceI